MHDGGGCGYWRVQAPLKVLAERGHEVDFYAYPDEATSEVSVADRLRKGDYDVVLAQRLVDMSLYCTWQEVKRSGKGLVYEIDDDVFSINPENTQAKHVFARQDVRVAIRDFAVEANLMTCTTEPLAEVFRDIGVKDVRVLPNWLPNAAYSPPVVQEGHRASIGWIGGSSHGRDVFAAAPSVRRVMEHHKDWDLLIGGHDFRDAFGVPGAIHVPWRHIAADDVAYFQSLDVFDIGIAPIIENKFNISKSAIKAMEYGARGIPVIASDCAAYRDYVIHGETGFLARTPRDWTEYLHVLMTDEGLRQKMGAAARVQAARHRLVSHGFWWEVHLKEAAGIV